MDLTTFPKHIIAVSAYIKNEVGQVLLVKTNNRSDTWELPGGQVENGESPHMAICREIYEETSLKVKPIGVIGIHYNETIPLLCLIFNCEYVSGEIKLQIEEIIEADFIDLSEDNISEYITRPHLKSRVNDALKATSYISYESWRTEPFQLLYKLGD